MSGADAIRGFVFQSMTSVFSSLQDTDWEFMTVEPDTPNEKVDILWEYRDGTMRCQQVKSSINTFSRADIEKWLIGMVQDVPTARSYQLTLIGDRDGDTGKFLKLLHANKVDDLALALQPFSSRLVVETLPFSMDMFRRTVQDQVNEFLSLNDYAVKHDTLALITAGLLDRVLESSASQKRWTRKQWRDMLLKWIDRNYKNSLHFDSRVDGLSVGIYIASTHEIVRSATAFRYKLPVDELVSVYFDKARRLYQTIQSLPLPPAPVASRRPLLADALFPEKYASKQYYVTIRLEEENYLSAKLWEYLQERMPAGLCQLGNLQQNTIRFPAAEFGDTLDGTENEKKKYAAIRALQDTFILMDELAATFRYVNGLYFLPLVVVNAGSDYDEDIEVTLSVPDEVTVITASDFYQPRHSAVLDQVLDDEILLDLLKIKDTSAVDGYSHTQQFLVELPGSLFDVFSGRTEAKEIERKQDKFVDKLRNLFERKLYNDTPGYKRIRYHFPQLNPNRKVAMPSHFLFHAAKSFDITYQILSKKSPARQSGALHCEIPSAATDSI